MYSIFFDLETSDKNPIGQILNYAFLVVDAEFEIVDELTGLIQISRLQLPSAGAILANKTDVIAHQKIAIDTEQVAMKRIVDFFEKIISGNGGRKLPVVGYNSSRFDVPYLRTSLIRNGLNPYFGGKIVNKDLLFCARKLAISAPGFPRAVPATPRRDDGEPRISLSLENLCHQFELLSGKQSHESRDDVVLTIRLAQIFMDRYQMDCRSYDAVECFSDETRRSRGTVRWSAFPDYAPDAESTSIEVPMVLLDADHRSSLWIDLNRYAEGAGKRAVSWFNHSGGSSFFLGKEHAITPEQQEFKAKALKEFEALTLKNFFQTSNCDIEQDIYRLDFDAIDALSLAIWNGNEKPLRALKTRDAKVVYLRHQIAEVPAHAPFPPQLEERLTSYALYRYGGQAKLSKSDVDAVWQEGVYSSAFHPTYNELVSEIEACREQVDGQDRVLMESLHEFYRTSDINRLAGDKLRLIHRKADQPKAA